jgi:hypothetical protein
MKPDIETINWMIDVAELASLKTRIEDDKLSPDLTLRAAQRKYGITNVNRWIKESLVHPRKDGDRNSKVRIDRVEIEAVNKASNRGL